MADLPSLEEIRALLGKRVRAWNSLEPPHYVVGVLTGFTDDGEFDVKDSMGITNYCWPLLKIEELHD